MRGLGEALQLALDQVAVEPGREYAIAGVYSFGRGLFARRVITASETAYKKLHRLHEGQLVMSRLKAFEGAIAVVPPKFDGWFLSPEFPTFACSDGALDPAYLRHVCQWQEFWSMLAAKSTGIGARRERVHASAVLALEIPLPPVDEQGHTAAHLDNVEQCATLAAAQLDRQDAGLLLRHLPALLGGVAARAASGRIDVSELVDFVSDTVHPGDDPAPADCFVGLQHIESHTGKRTGLDDLSARNGRKFRFRPGDVIYGYLRPYLNKVWLADRHGLCSVDQYVLRPREGISAPLLAHLLRTEEVLQQAAELTHNLQLPRLRSGLLASIEVPAVPDTAVSAVLARLEHIQDSVIRAAALRAHQERLVASLIPAALNEAFAGLS